MKKAAPADLQRWSEELARDPTSLAFLPLARAYRRQNRADAALRLCLRGLAHHPDNTEAHGLLALLYVDRGDHARAADEWSFVLRLDPSNFEALRGLGFCLLENGDLTRARNRLERAALIRPDDAAVRDALRLVLERTGEEGDAEMQPATASGDAPVPPADTHAGFEEPWMETPDPATFGAPQAITFDEAAPFTAPEPEPWAPASVAAAAGATEAAPVPHEHRSVPGDPHTLFDTLVSGPVLGALLLDTRGMLLAGTLEGGTHETEALAAVLGGAIGEAARTAGMLGLGEWHGLLMETPRALLHVARVGEDAVVLLVARPDAPAGWMLRSAAQAATLAERFLETYA